MNLRPAPSSARVRGWVSIGVAAAVLTLVAFSGLGIPGRAAAIAGICLVLWLTGQVPVWAPTLILWAATAVLLGSGDSRFSLLAILRWSADPVLALFLGGFALAAAAQRHGVDRTVATIALKRAGKSATRLIAAAALATALLSMWMSNVAAAALMFNAFKPIWGREPEHSPLRRSLLLAIALAADVGGIATPIGTGANGIAMAAVAHVHPISFIHWMAFGVPLAFGLVVAAVALIVTLLRPTTNSSFNASLKASLGEQGDHDASEQSENEAPKHSTGARRALGVLFGVTIVLWLSEPLHGIPAWLAALGAVVGLVALRILPLRDLLKIDWSTLLLVAGGIGMGGLLDRSGIVHSLAASLPLADTAPLLAIFVLCVFSALMASAMSNTGTAALMIPLALSLNPSPSTAILIAVAASLGMPFVVSTPPNAMAVAAGLPSSDLLVPGLILMIGGCALIALTGPFVLHAVGVP